MTNPKTKLSDKAQRATDHYINNTIIDPKEGYTWSQAMRDAGYAETTIDSKPKETWGYVGVQEQINEAIASIKAKAVFSRVERQEWWCKMMQDGKTDADKLRASELLGRSEADFTDNIANTVPDQTETLSKEDQIEALRAQIRLLDEAGDAGTAIAV